MKNNIDFYQHYASSDQHPKFKMLRVKYGWSGEGKFWALNNRIAQAENCCLDISKKYNKAAIASDLDFNMDEFDDYISYLLDECELVRECEGGVITTDIVQENYQRVNVDRVKARERAARRWPNNTVTTPENKEFSPENKCKVKESKVNNIIYPPNFVSFWEKYPKKIGKGYALKAYQNIKSPKPSLQTILDAIEQHNKSDQWSTTKYIPNPATWINQRRWEDEIESNIIPLSHKPKTIEEREQEEKELFANR